jgi:demethylmenaquinone methyltransferase / 2-methoxy-6-polyprenyl-1,4-benzoquinol methylase
VTKSVRNDVPRMFDRISSTYDLLNHLFSFGIDYRWRNRAIRALKMKPGQSLLDCSAGTGDMSFTAHKMVADVHTILLDPAQAMLAIADTKAQLLRPKLFRLVRGSAEQIPFADDTFDHFTVAFGIRNFSDLKVGMEELFRTLKSGGTGAILEFTPDRSRRIDRMFQWYMRAVMQPLGALISGDKEAYTYLSRTVQSFQTTSLLEKLFLEIGFNCLITKRLSFGVATLFILEKP